MSVAGRAYVVREDSTGPEPGKVDRLYPYTLKGLTDALEEARFRSFAGTPHLVAVAAESGIRVIRKYERGHEVSSDGPPGLARNSGDRTGGPA
jgi:hypothetical protein